MVTLGSYYGCVSERLGRSGFKLTDIFTCARKFPADVEPILVQAYGDGEAEKVKDLLLKEAHEGQLNADELSIASTLLEIFLGGSGVSLFTGESIANIEKVYRELSELGILQGNRSESWAWIIREVKARVQLGVSSAEGSATPLLALDHGDLPWATGYLWPAFVEQVRGEGVETLVSRVVESLETGRRVELAGGSGSGRLALLYQSLEELMKRGFTVYFGPVDQAVRLSGKKVVFTGYRIAPAGGGGEYARIEVGGRLSRGELEGILDRIAVWDGLSLSSSEKHEIIESSRGNPGFIETVLAYLSLSRMLNKSFTIPTTVDEAIARLREAVPNELRVMLEIPAAINARCFPTTLIEVPDEHEALIEKILLRHEQLGLYSWRSLISREAFRKPIISPPALYKHVFSSESPFHAAWFTVLSQPSTARYIAAEALNRLGEEESYGILEAVAILAPGVVSRLLGDATTYRLAVLEGAAENAGSLALAEELASKAVAVLEALNEEALREKYLEFKVKLAELRLARLLPELALETLKDVGAKEESIVYRVTKLKGAALLGLKAYSDAAKYLREAIRLAETQGYKEDAYSLRTALVDALALGGSVQEAAEEADRLVKELVREDCSYAGLLYSAAARHRELRGKSSPAVCASLIRCGYPDLAAAYGCFS